MKMRTLKQSLITWLTGFLSCVALVSIESCKHQGPKVVVYLSEPTRNGMEFYNEENGQRGFIDYAQTDKFVCLNQVDMQAMFYYCDGKKKK